MPKDEDILQLVSPLLMSTPPSLRPGAAFQPLSQEGVILCLEPFPSAGVGASLSHVLAPSLRTQPCGEH